MHVLDCEIEITIICNIYIEGGKIAEMNYMLHTISPKIFNDNN